MFSGYKNLCFIQFYLETQKISEMDICDSKFFLKHIVAN